MSNIVATKTANSQYHYDDKYFGKTLHMWQCEVHRHLCHKMNWYYHPLKKGQYGYDNLIMSLGYIFDNIKLLKKNKIKNGCARLAHNGWKSNYVYWRDNKPWFIDSKYISPKKKLGDCKRNKLADTKFYSLYYPDKVQNYIIAEYVLLKILL